MCHSFHYAIALLHLMPCKCAKDNQNPLLPSLVPTKFAHLSSLLGKLDAENQVLETKAIHVRASLRSVVAVRVGNEGKALGHTSLSVLGQEDSCDVTVSAEECAKLVLLCKLGNLARC